MNNFDGRIFMKRVSQQKKIAKGSRNKQFSVDVQVNEELCQGGWRRIVTAHKALDLIIDVYDRIYKIVEK